MTVSEGSSSKGNANAGNVGTFWKAKLRCPSFLSLVVAVVIFSVFLPVIQNDFVNYDDPDYVTANSHVQSGLNWQNIRWAFTTGHASNWHPLTWLSHMMDCQLFGLSAGAHHLVSAGFHVINAILLLLLFNSITGALWRSTLVAALFALHPLHVESVAWVSERKDVLSTFFWMLTLLAYVGYVSRLGPGGTDVAEQTFVRKNRSLMTGLPAPLLYTLSLALFVMGLMSKPMLVTLPFVLLLLDYWPLGRCRFADLDWAESAANHRPSYSARKAPLSTLILEKLPFFVLSILSSYVTFIVQRQGGAVSTSISASDRIANAFISYVRYLGKLFWPEKLAVLYPHPGHWPASHVVGAMGLLLLISVGVVVLARKRPYLAVGWCWFIGTLVPTIGLVQVGVQSMADRYTYIPLIGLFIMLVWGAGDLLLAKLGRQPLSSLQSTRSSKKGESRQKADAVKVDTASTWSLDLSWGSGFGVWSFVIGLVLVACVFLTSVQLQYWRNSQTLFSHAVKVTTGNYLAYNNLGFYLSHLGKASEAMENYRKALEINPGYEDALNNMGYALAGQKRPAEAIPYDELALRVRPNHVEVHNNLGNALAELGRTDEAIAQYQIVLKHQPDHVDAHNNLGVALAKRGQLEEGISHFLQAIRHKPNDPGAHSNLGNALAAQSKFKEAIKEYQESLRLKPDDAQAHNNLGNVLAEEGRLLEAIPHYEQALKLNEDNPEAHFNLGMALARQDRRAEAAAHFTEALRLKPDYAQAQAQLELLSAAQRK